MLMSPATLRRQAGFLLLEVVVALLLFSLGIGGMLRLQARASQLALAAEDRGRASSLANELVATMWAQRTLNVNATDLSTWTSKVGNMSAGGLPNGVGAVTLDNPSAPQLATITITWRPIARDTTDTAHQYITKVVLP
jgi:type IV pilus assembly protein PilV